MHSDTEICFACVACRQPVTATVRMVGRPVRCPRCLAKLVVPPCGDGPKTQLVDVEIVQLAELETRPTQPPPE